MSVLDLLRSNQIASGGLLVVATGAALAWLATVRSVAWAWLVARVSVTVEIKSNDPLFEVFEEWLARQDAGRRRRVLTASTRTTWDDDHESRRVALILTPGEGRHVVTVGGRRLIVDRARHVDRQLVVSTVHATGRDRETITLTTLGCSRALIEGILEHCRVALETASDASLRVHVATGMDGWRRIPGRPRRRLATVCLREDLAGVLEADLRRFLDANAWYADRGLPYRRGYLFFGPPGTGKTSTVEGLASEFNLPLYRMPLSSRCTDDELIARIGEIPPRSILLLEDVDACMPSREKTDGLTLSGLLNALDGVTTPHGLIVFMTTNHVERLDPALTRPGRCDVRLEFGPADAAQARAMYLKFFPGDAAGADRFAATLAPGESPASLQERLVRMSA